MSVKVITKEGIKYFARFFHVYANNKIIKELDIEEARNMMWSNKTVVAVSKRSVNISHKHDRAWVSKKSLLAILEETEK